MKKGFTLVELAIVLVVIGLLVGGILAAQSMIASARINAQAQQIAEFDASVMAFKTKYNYLPGDAPGFGGDGDGLIDATSIGGSIPNDVTAIFTCELANFWSNLDNGRFPSSPSTSCTLQGLKAQTTGLNKNVPASKMGSEGSFFVADSITKGPTSVYANTINPQNYYVILSGRQLQNIFNGRFHIAASTSDNSAVRPVDLMALDVKTDDGIPNSGNVLSGNIISSSGSGACPGSPTCGGPYISPLATCSSGTVYAATQQGYECTPLIRIGGIAGNPF